MYVMSSIILFHAVYKMKKVSAKKPVTDVDVPEDSADDVLFWINKSGFPISNHVWNRMFNHATKNNPGGEISINQIKSAKYTTAVRQ